MVILRFRSRHRIKSINRFPLSIFMVTPEVSLVTALKGDPGASIPRWELRPWSVRNGSWELGAVGAGRAGSWEQGAALGAVGAGSAGRWGLGAGCSSRSSGSWVQWEQWEVGAGSREQL